MKNLPCTALFAVKKDKLRHELENLLDFKLKENNPKLLELTARVCFDSNYHEVKEHWKSSAKD